MNILLRLVTIVKMNFKKCFCEKKYFCVKFALFSGIWLPGGEGYGVQRRVAQDVLPVSVA